MPRSTAQHSAAAKANEALQTPCSISSANVSAELHRGLQRHLVRILGGDGNRDLDNVDCHPDPAGDLYEGTWQGHRRMLATLLVDARAQTAEVILIATKGTVEADPALFWRRGQDIGNTILVARLFHVAIFFARAAGLAALTNHPYTPRLARKYERMGFVNGTRLPLDDLGQLSKAFAYVENVYVKDGLSLALAPLPL